MRANGNGKTNGKAPKLPFSEYDDLGDAERQHQFYCELEWIRIERQRKPGWTAFTFKELFGRWPASWLKTLTPQVPRDELLRWIKRRDNAWKRAVRKREAEAKAGNGAAALRAAYSRPD